MSFYKLIIFSLVLLISSVDSFTQDRPHIWINNISNTNFPQVRIDYTIIGPNGIKIPQEDIIIDHLQIQENGINQNIVNGVPNARIKCDTLSEDVPLSVVLALDVTQSLTAGPINYLEWIQEAASQFVDSLDYDNGSEVHIVKWAGSAESSEWSSNEAKLLDDISKLEIKNGATNFNTAFEGINGAIEQLKNAKDNNKKIILFFTDGDHIYQGDPNSFEWQRITDACREVGAEVYAVQTNQSESNWRLDFLSEGTGGDAYFVNSKNDLKDLFRDFFLRLSAKEYSRCFIEYDSSIPCANGDIEREIRIDYTRYSQYNDVFDTGTLNIPESMSKSINYNSDKLYFSKTGTQSHQITVTAKNSDFYVSGFNITPNLENFSISPTNFTVTPENPVDVTITYDISDDSETDHYDFKLLSDACSTPIVEMVASCDAVTSDRIVDLGEVPQGVLGTRLVDIKNQTDETITGTLTLINDPNNAYTLLSPQDLTLGPKEEKLIEIEYLPTFAESFSAELIYSFNSDCGDLSITIEGLGISGSLGVDRFDFEKQRQGTTENTVLTISNSSQSSVEITNIEFAYDIVTQFNMLTDLSAELPITLDPSDIFPISVDFTPDSENTFAQGLVITTIDGSQENFDNVLLGEGTLPNIDAVDLNFGTFSEATDVIDDVNITNTNSTEALIIGEVRIQAGSDPEGNFEIVAPVNNQSVEIAGFLPVSIRFNPKSNGTKRAVLEIVHNAEIGDTSVDEIYTVNLQGILNIENEFQPLSPLPLNFGNVKACDNSILSVSINNPNDYEIEVNLFEDEMNSDFSISTTNITLSPGQNNDIFDVSFNPTEAKNYTGLITLTDINSNELGVINLSGTGEISNATINVTSAKDKIVIDEMLDLSFKVDLSNVPDDAIVDELAVFFDYNYRQFKLDLEESTLDGSANSSIEILERNGEINTAKITLPDFTNLTNVSLKLRSLLFNLKFADVNIYNENTECFNITSDSHSFEIESCSNELSGVNISGNYSFERIYPNPVTSNLKLNYSIAIDAHTTISIIDVTGNEVMEPLDEFIEKGDYQLTLNTNQMKSGIYYIRINSLHWSDFQKIAVTK